MESLQDIVPEIENNAGSKSTGFIMKLVLIIVMIVVVVFFVRIGIAIIFALQDAGKSPYLVDGMIKGTRSMIIEQNPELDKSVTIYRSKNETTGLEFTWSTWLNIEESNYSDTTEPDKYNDLVYKHIFHKGNLGILENDGDVVANRENSGDNDRHTLSNMYYVKHKDSTVDYQYKFHNAGYLGFEKGMSFPNNSPGLYLKENTNELTFVLNVFSDLGVDMTKTYFAGILDANGVTVDQAISSSEQPTFVKMENKIMEKVDISNIPLDKWFHLAIRMKNNILDIYINGIITQRRYLTNVVKQNYYNIYINQNGGWNGLLSALRYDNRALSAIEIEKLYKKGPKTNTIASSDLATDDERNVTNLSTKWYY
jgi:hypothetical protein